MENKVHVANPKLLEEKINRIRSDGSESFHVVSDFDRTLTKAFVHGKRTHSSLAQLRESGYLEYDYSSRLFALYDEYRPIEIDEKLPLKEKIDKMREWWQKALDLAIESGLKKEIVEDIINKGKTVPRPGSFEFYDMLNENNIPLLIFSAGIGDIIRGFLEKEGKLYDNIQIIANFYDFDEKGFARGYVSDIIHSFNKNESHIRKTPNYSEIKNRKNIMLLGDTTGDLGMLKGLEPDTAIRVGFLNEGADGSLEKFMELFDVVILGDGRMDYVNKILSKILA